ncbi:hypothetical protein ACJBU6_08694 [Exserohilum turcicum]
MPAAIIPFEGGSLGSINTTSPSPSPASSPASSTMPNSLLILGLSTAATAVILGLGEAGIEAVVLRGVKFVGWISGMFFFFFYFLSLLLPVLLFLFLYLFCFFLSGRVPDKTRQDKTRQG